MLLERQAARKRKETGNDEWHSSAAFRRGTKHDKESWKILRKAVLTAWARPFKLLAFQPIIQVMAGFMAYSYGLMYLFLSSFAALWQEKYKESQDISGLNYIALAVGMILGAQFAVHGQPRVCHLIPPMKDVANQVEDIHVPQREEQRRWQTRISSTPPHVRSHVLAYWHADLWMDSAKSDSVDWT